MNGFELGPSPNLFAAEMVTVMNGFECGPSPIAEIVTLMNVD